MRPSGMICSVTPRSSSISSVDGCSEAARWSSTGAGSCSNTVTAMPRRFSASAHTIPTGPAPTMTTRALAFDPVIRLLLSRLLLQLEARHDAVPQRGVGDKNLHELFGRGQQRLQAHIRHALFEL